MRQPDQDAGGQASGVEDERHPVPPVEVLDVLEDLAVVAVQHVDDVEDDRVDLVGRPARLDEQLRFDLELSENDHATGREVLADARGAVARGSSELLPRAAELQEEAARFQEEAARFQEEAAKRREKFNVLQTAGIGAVVRHRLPEVLASVLAGAAAGWSLGSALLRNLSGWWQITDPGHLLATIALAALGAVLLPLAAQRFGARTRR